MPWLILLVLSIGAMSAGAAPSPERQAQLHHMLVQDCGSCHGLTLRGGLGPALLPQQLRGKPKEFLIMTIRDGRPGTAMPPWRPFMSLDEAAWLVDQLLAGEAVR